MTPCLTTAVDSPVVQRPEELDTSWYSFGMSIDPLPNRNSPPIRTMQSKIGASEILPMGVDILNIRESLCHIHLNARTAAGNVIQQRRFGSIHASRFMLRQAAQLGPISRQTLIVRAAAIVALLRGLLVFGLIMAAVLCVGEVLLRILDFSALRIPESSNVVLNGGDAVQPDAELGWSQIPNVVTQSTTGNRTVSVRHNSLGLREKELNEDAPDGTFVFLGDSMVWGLDAEVGERFTDLLQDELPQHRMVNAGVLGFGTDQELLLVQRLWTRLAPRVVVLTFSNDNDRDDNTSSLRYQTNYKPYFVQVAEGEWQIRGYPLPPPARAYGSGNPWVEHFALARAAALAWAGLRYNELIVPDPTEDLVEMLRRTAQARGAVLVVGLQRRDAKLEAYLQSRQVPYVTLEDAQRYELAGGHWTPDGNRLVASRYRGVFEKAGILSTLTQPADWSALIERNGRALAEVAARLDRAGASPADLVAASNELEPVHAALHALAAHNERGRSPQLDTAMQRAGPLAVQADRLAGRLSELRGELSNTSPWTPSASVLSPSLWLQAAAALPPALERLVGQGRFWIAAVRDGGGAWRGTAVLLILTVFYIVMGIAWLWWRQRIIAAGEGDAYFAKTLSSLRDFLRIALVLPIVVIGVGEALEVHMFEISRSVYIGTVVAAFGQAVAFAVLAPQARWRRLIGADDRTARGLALDLSAAAISLGWLYILLGMGRAVAAPAVLSTAINMLFVIVVAAIVLHALLLTRPGAGGQRAWNSSHASTARAAGWVCLALMVLALLAGYGALAARFAAFVVSLVAAVGAIYLLCAVGKILYVDRYAPGGPREAALAGNFGLGAGWLWLGEGLTTGAIVAGIALAAFVLIVRP
jgi:Protein of unknown function (DUF3772)